MPTAAIDQKRDWSIAAVALAVGYGLGMYRVKFAHIGGTSVDDLHVGDSLPLGASVFAFVASITGKVSHKVYRYQNGTGIVLGPSAEPVAEFTWTKTRSTGLCDSGPPALLPIRGNTGGRS